MSIMVSLQPMGEPAHLIEVPLSIQLGDLRKAAAHHFQWNTNTAFYGACSIAMAVGELPCADMYETLAGCGVTGNILVTLVRIPVPLAIVAAEHKMPETLQSIELAGQALRLWVCPYERRTSQTMDFMTLAEMQSEIGTADRWMREKTHPVARGAAMANKCIERVLQSDIVVGGEYSTGELIRALNKACTDTRDVMVMLCRGMSDDEATEQAFRNEFMRHAEQSYGTKIDKDLEACLIRSNHITSELLAGAFPLLQHDFGGPRPRLRGQRERVSSHAILSAAMSIELDEAM